MRNWALREIQTAAVAKVLTAPTLVFVASAELGGMAS